MITLGFIVYVIFSLMMSWYTYDDMYLGFSTRKNERYRNKKKSLIYGFSYLLILILSLTVIALIMFCIFEFLSFSIDWILTNMP